MSNFIYRGNNVIPTIKLDGESKCVILPLAQSVEIQTSFSIASSKGLNGKKSNSIEDVLVCPRASISFDFLSRKDVIEGYLLGLENSVFENNKKYSIFSNINSKKSIYINFTQQEDILRIINKKQNSVYPSKIIQSENCKLSSYEMSASVGDFVRIKATFECFNILISDSEISTDLSGSTYFKTAKGIKERIYSYVEDGKNPTEEDLRPKINLPYEVNAIFSIGGTQYKKNVNSISVSCSIDWREKYSFKKVLPTSSESEIDNLRPESSEVAFPINCKIQMSINEEDIKNRDLDSINTISGLNSSFSIEFKDEKTGKRNLLSIVGAKMDSFSQNMSNSGILTNSYSFSLPASSDEINGIFYTKNVS